jgi:hypothetical protein
MAWKQQESAAELPYFSLRNAAAAWALADPALLACRDVMGEIEPAQRFR